MITSRLLLSVGVVALSISFVVKGIWAIKHKSIYVRWIYTPGENHTGTSAVIWGWIYMVLGVVFFVSYVLIQSDYFWTQKLNLDRLIR